MAAMRHVHDLIISAPSPSLRRCQRTLFVRCCSPIEDTEDPHVKKIAKFAVAEYGKRSGVKLELQKVVSGTRLVVAGFKYRLLLAASDGSPPSSRTKEYYAEVWEKRWMNFRALLLFEPWRGRDVSR